MKGWLIFFILPLAVIVSAVLVQVELTRRAMGEFARRHGLAYQRPSGFIPALFGPGSIEGTLDGSAFTMGMQMTNYGFGRVAEQNYPQSTRLYMYTGVKGMPRKLVVRHRRLDPLSEMTEAIDRQTGVPLVKTGDPQFDGTMEVIGYPDEALPWLTPGRREALAWFLSEENYVVYRGGIGRKFVYTRIPADEMEETFTRLMEARGRLLRER